MLFSFKCLVNKVISLLRRVGIPPFPPSCIIQIRRWWNGFSVRSSGASPRWYFKSHHCSRTVSVPLDPPQLTFDTVSTLCGTISSFSVSFHNFRISISCSWKCYELGMEGVTPQFQTFPLHLFLTSLFTFFWCF